MAFDCGSSMLLISAALAGLRTSIEASADLPTSSTKSPRLSTHVLIPHPQVRTKCFVGPYSGLGVSG